MHGAVSGQSTTSHGNHEVLSASELHRLTLFKWRYSLEALGFEPQEVDQLMFLTWLRATRRVHG